MVSLKVHHIPVSCEQSSYIEKGNIVTCMLLTKTQGHNLTTGNAIYMIWCFWWYLVQHFSFFLIYALQLTVRKTLSLSQHSLENDCLSRTQKQLPATLAQEVTVKQATDCSNVLTINTTVVLYIGHSKCFPVLVLDFLTIHGLLQRCSWRCKLSASVVLTSITGPTARLETLSSESPWFSATNQAGSYLQLEMGWHISK